MRFSLSEYLAESIQPPNIITLFCRGWLPVFLCAVLLLSSPLGTAHAQVWKFVDQNGVLTFSNERPSGVEASLLLGTPEKAISTRETTSSLTATPEDMAKAASRTAAWIMSSPRYHSVKKDLQMAADAGMLGSIDANRGDYQNGWVALWQLHHKQKT